MNSLSRRLEKSSLYIALLAAWIAMLGSLFFSEVMGYIPCTLCWYQRIIMYPLTAIIAVGILRRDTGLPIYILPFSVLGIVVSSYHYLLQKTDLFGGVSACQEGIPCSTMWFNWFGFVTIPFLALLAFLTITMMAAIALMAEEPIWETETKTPWLGVGGAIGAVCLFFALLLLMGNTSEPVDVADPAFDLTEPLAIGEAMPTETEIIRGKELYLSACAACHGANMQGVPNVGVSLIDSALVNKLESAALLTFIRAGRTVEDPNNTTGIAMPPSGGRADLSDDDMLAIIRYLQAS